MRTQRKFTTRVQINDCLVPGAALYPHDSRRRARLRRALPRQRRRQRLTPNEQVRDLRFVSDKVSRLVFHKSDSDFGHFTRLGARVYVGSSEQHSRSYTRAQTPVSPTLKHRNVESENRSRGWTLARAASVLPVPVGDSYGGEKTQTD